MDGYSETTTVEHKDVVEEERPTEVTGEEEVEENLGLDAGQVTLSGTTVEQQQPDSGLNDTEEPWSPARVDRASLEKAWNLRYVFPKKLLILDVNGLLVARYQLTDLDVPLHGPHKVVARSYMFKRPFCDSFLDFCFANFDVGFWSSMNQKNLFDALHFVCPAWPGKCRFVRHQTHCTRTRFSNPEKRRQPLFLKPLWSVWKDFPEFNASNTLLVDDTPYKALVNPPFTAVFPEAYFYNEADAFLHLHGPLVEYLTHLRDAVNVPEFVRAQPFGLPALGPESSNWDLFQQVVNEYGPPDIPLVPVAQ